MTHPQPPEQARTGHVRHMILALAGLGAVHSYFVRVGLAPASKAVQEDLGISPATMGSIFSAFYLGYFLSQIPGGWLGTKLGARLALPLLAMIWSGSTFWASQCRTGEELYYARVLTGLAQGGLFPIVARVIRDWYPPDRRATASGVPNACMAIGAVAATAGITQMMALGLDWRQSLAIVAALGVAWAIVFRLTFRDDPERHPWVDPAELALITAGRNPDESARESAKANASWSEWFARFIPEAAALAVSVSFWALCLQSIFRAFGHALFFTWFPQYLSESRGISMTEAGKLAAFPLGSVIIGSLLGGVVSDRILKATGSLRASRSLLTVGVLLGTGLSFVAMDNVGGPAWFAVAIVTFGMFLFGVSGTTTWAATIDLGRERTSIVFAIMNMTGNIGAWACPVVVGLLIEAIKAGRQDWSIIAWVFLGNFVLAAACWIFLDPNRPIHAKSADIQS